MMYFSTLTVRSYEFAGFEYYFNEKKFMWYGGHHSSVVLSAPTILRPWVQIPSTPSMLFSFCN